MSKADGKKIGGGASKKPPAKDEVQLDLGAESAGAGAVEPVELAELDSSTSLVEPVEPVKGGAAKSVQKNTAVDLIAKAVDAGYGEVILFIDTDWGFLGKSLKHVTKDDVLHEDSVKVLKGLTSGE